MEIVECRDASSFRRLADPLLLEREDTNNLILGVTGLLMVDPKAFESFRSWAVLAASGPVAAGVVAGRNNLIVAAARSARGVELLAHEVEGVPGATGPVPSIETFVAARSDEAHLTMSQGIFSLTRVAALPAAPGESRPAASKHTDTLTEWFAAFQLEALGEQSEDDKALRQSVASRVATQDQDFGVWVHEVDGRPVAMSSHNAPTPNGIRVSAVYTPPEHREKGYATTLVAKQSRWLLERGHRFCFLYTDLSNPTSNAIYRRIGYEQVAESREYGFSR
jgi:RimJ/RimL family protein N-acetyltransferase